MMLQRPRPRLRAGSVVALTGGPGGGKSTLIEELLHDPAWTGRIAALPEAIVALANVRVSPREKLFQRLMVHVQMGMEEGLTRALGPSDSRLILCHRGTLDPLAYWLDRGWDEDEFFSFTETTRAEHHARYRAVVHLVTAADGAADAYKRWPEAHRPETIEEAIRIDRLLERVWGAHPNYVRIDNRGKDWAAKAREAKKLLSALLGP